MLQIAVYLATFPSEHLCPKTSPFLGGLKLAAPKESRAAENCAWQPHSWASDRTDLRTLRGLACTG